MKILVIRHAIAEESSLKGRYEDRPVSEKGHKQFHEICKNLVHFDWKFDLLFQSPLLRSQQTADIFCKYFPIESKKSTKNLRPLSLVDDLFLEIKAYDKKFVVIVGHQPFLTDFISYCVTGNSRAFIFLERGGMALLHFPSSVAEGSASLDFLCSPKLLLRKIL